MDYTARSGICLKLNLQAHRRSVQQPGGGGGLIEVDGKQVQVIWSWALPFTPEDVEAAVRRMCAGL